jgi:glucose dehydrogenase
MMGERRSAALLIRVAIGMIVALAGGRLSWGDPVDTTRLLGAGQDTKNWLLPGRDYSNQRYVALDQITTQNVKSLTLRWKFRTGISEAFQTTPLVADGIIYVTTPKNHLVALDARTGKQLWRYEYPLNTKGLCCGSANRGAGMGYGKLFMATADAHLIAIDQNTGKLAWNVALAPTGEGKVETIEALSVADPLRQAVVTGASGIGANMAPLVYDGKVIVGVTGVGYGLHLDNTQGKKPIGLLDHLWIGPIPAAFNRIKVERAQEGREAVFDRSERFIDGKLLAQIGLAFQPQVFERILLRGIRSK